MQGIYSYYFLVMLLSFALAQPWMVGALVVLFLLRDKLPDPRRWWSARGRRIALERDAKINTSNVKVRRDLAMLAIERKDASAALRYVDEALQREPNNAELLLVRAEGLVLQGRYTEAIPTLVDVHKLDARAGFGRPYWLASIALEHSGKLAEAIDAAERYVSASSSDPDGYVQLAALQRKAGDDAGADKTMSQAARVLGHSVWVIPGARRAWSRKDSQSALVAAGLVVVALLGSAALRGRSAPSRNADLPFQE